MAPLKLLLLVVAVLAVVGILLVEPHRQSPAEAQRLAAAPAPHVRRSALVQKHYLAHTKNLQAYYELLLEGLKADAPDLLPLLKSPRPPQHGYQILPAIITDSPAPKDRPRARSSWYSWPWTDKLIENALWEIARSEAELKRAPTFSSTERRTAYEKLARGYHQLRERQRNIDAHMQYNHLWQTVIANNRSSYDRETVLHNAVLERQAILDALKATGEAVKSGLMEREKLLARDIHNAIDPVRVPAFLRAEHRGPRLWILHVPFYTDIDNHGYVRSVKEMIESIWCLRDGEDEFRVELAISYVPVSELYANGQPPRTGEQIDAHQHLALFLPDRAVLTTGALTTHVYSRAIILGSHDITPRVLAHEFGHILGFKDSYFRGYKDLGKDGFQVMEVVAEPNNIMGVPGTGPVLRSHFEKILEHLGYQSRRDETASDEKLRGADLLGSTDQRMYLHSKIRRTSLTTTA